MTEQEFLDRLPEFLGTITFYFNKRLGHPPNAEQMAAYLRWAAAGATGEQMDETLAREPEAVAFAASGGVHVTPERPRGPAQPLVVRGPDFVDANGDRRVLRGTDQFLALRQVIDGADLQPLLDESANLGFDLWRVFSMGSRQQNGILDLRPQNEQHYDDAVASLVGSLNDHGIVLLLCAYVDNQDVNAGDGHWLRLANILRGRVALLSGGNEWSKNGFDPGRLTDPGMLWSRGSNVEDIMPFDPPGSYMEFHPRRLWPTIMLDAVASPVEIYKHRPPIPLIIDEPARMGAGGSGDVYADPHNCWRFARHYSTECAGAVFHSHTGFTGQVLDPDTYRCALAWQDGMRI